MFFCLKNDLTKCFSDIKNIFSKCFSDLENESPVFERLSGAGRILVAIGQGVGNEQNLKNLKDLKVV